ncbi:MAG: hypothetical protein DWQ05_00685 [Calditrichaeota bacterium]|nr:MAG: hypothetical protein DWQ05_00685 [Calditrichota bacterium]
MSWSKIKKSIEITFAASMRNRVELHATCYDRAQKNPQNYDARAWITIDGTEFIRFSATDSWHHFGAHFHETTITECETHRAVEKTGRTPGNLMERGEFSKQDFLACCQIYPNLDFQSAVTNPSPIIQMIAFLDSRLGKGKLKKMSEEKMHPLPRAIFQIRKEAELR